EATDGGLAGVGVAEAFEDFDGAGFTRSVRAEEAEDFAFLDGKADAADGFDVAVAFEEVFNVQNGSGHGNRPEEDTVVRRFRRRREMALNIVSGVFTHAVAEDCGRGATRLGKRCSPMAACAWA